MPFQSEKQRRYLWANEPEIAREWTDRYGANQGGIMRVPFYEGTDINDPLYQGLGHNLGDTLSSIGTTISDALITPLGSATDEGLPSLDITGKPNYGFEEMDKWGIDRMNLEKEDEVVSRSFKDHDNLKSWLDANPDMGAAAIQKAKDFYEGGVETLGNIWQGGKDKASWLKNAALTGIGKAINFPIGLMANAFPNPLSVGSSNYNPSLQPQIDMLNKMGMLSGSSGSSGPYKITSGALRGKNLVSGFGTNDYNKMLAKKQAWFQKRKEDKKSFSQKQWDKLKAEKKAADEAAAARAAASKKQWQQDYSNWQSPSGRDHSTTGGIGSAQSKQGHSGSSHVGASRFQ